MGSQAEGSAGGGWSQPCRYVILSLIWVVGGLCDTNSRLKFDQYLRRVPSASFPTWAFYGNLSEIQSLDFTNREDSTVISREFQRMRDSLDSP